jgi:DNA-binding MarR family transcriptional regulator|tara:strand:- start:16689 stop:17111 length:423 start_codon:yes stop_codon:yes gene_type:complete
MAMSATKRPASISLADYQTLSEFRYLIRCFTEFSQKAARDIGLTSRQHQALLAIKGFPGGGNVTIGALAERLQIRHHSAVELVNRLADSGLVCRRHSSTDQRQVILELTDSANHFLAELSAVHLEEIDRIRPLLRELLHD